MGEGGTAKYGRVWGLGGPEGSASVQDVPRESGSKGGLRKV